MSEHYRLRVNGLDHDVADAWLGENLLYVLRERLGLYGSKGACEQGAAQHPLLQAGADESRICRAMQTLDRPSC